MKKLEVMDKRTGEVLIVERKVIGDYVAYVVDGKLCPIYNYKVIREVE